MAKKKRVNWLNIVLISLIIAGIGLSAYIYISKGVEVIGGNKAPPVVSDCPNSTKNITRSVGCYQSYQNEQQCPESWSEPGTDCSSNDYPSFSSTNTDSACCPDKNYCTYGGVCYQNSDLTKIDEKEVICLAGKWIERDSTSKTCTGTSSCSNSGSTPAWASNYKWITAGGSGIGEYDNSTVTECCGDDTGEYVIVSSSISLCCNTPTSIIENSQCKTSPSACISNSSCSAATPFCDLSTGLCANCLSNYDCGIGYGCKNKTCSICEITDAAWSQSVAKENAKVNLTGKSSCGESENIYFKLYKKNTTGTFNIYDVDIEDAIIENNAYRVSWKIEVPEEDKSNFKYFYSAGYQFNQSLGIFANSTDLIINVTCTENWNCTGWNICTNNKQTRDCIDLNSCGTTVNKLSTNRSCTPETDCDNQIKDGDEMGTDCGGSCITESFEINCNDGIDDDNNCKTDCEDTNCKIDPVCINPVCGNNICDYADGEDPYECPEDCESEADSDSDGLSDSYEQKQGLNPASADTDSDSVNDKQDQWPLCDLSTCDSPYGTKRCPINCTPETPGIFDSIWIWVIAILCVAVLIGIILYIYVSKGKPKTGNSSKSLFINKRDETAIIEYVKKQIEKKVPDMNIRKILISKKWKNEQIDYAFKEARKSSSQQRPEQKKVQKK